MYIEKEAEQKALETSAEKRVFPLDKIREEVKFDRIRHKQTDRG